MQLFADIDECAQKSHTCDVNANCKNTVGSHNCQCHQGYYGNGNTCTGIDQWSSTKQLYNLHYRKRNSRQTSPL